MTPEDFLIAIIDPGLEFVEELGGPKPSDPVRHILLAIAMQESGQALDARYQNSPSSSPGPARGFWQFESGGGVHGVMTHAASSALAAKACGECAVANNEGAAWRALEGHDILAVAFARLLLWTDPYALPTDEAPAWDMYCNRLWRPGAPHPETWHDNWTRAGAAVAVVPMS